MFSDSYNISTKAKNVVSQEEETEEEDLTSKLIVTLI